MIVLSLAIIGGIISAYGIGGLFVKKDGATAPAIKAVHWGWPKAILGKIFK